MDAQDAASVGDGRDLVAFLLLPTRPTRVLDPRRILTLLCPMCSPKLWAVCQVPLPRWPHSRDTLSVWKRNEHAVVYYGSSDEDDEDDDEDEDEGDEDEEEEGETKDKSGTSKVSKKDRKGAASEEAPPAKKSKGGEDGDGVTKVGSKAKTKSKHKSEDMDMDTEKDKDKDKDDAKSSLKGNGALEGKGRKKKPLPGAKDGDGDDEDEEDGDAMEDGEALNASDVDSEMLESLMAGAGAAVPDCDMYAFIPADEQLRCEQAAPCMQFLLEESREKRE